MIDIHNHILPGLDDGSKSMEETLAIVRQLYKAGFKTLIATPHVLEERDFLSPREILETTEQVRKCVAEAGIPVEILPGSENYIFPDLAKWVRDEKLLTLGNTGKYLLVELPMLEIPQYTEQVFFDLQVQGLTPVLAHPERNKGLIDKPEHLLNWAKKGILFQLNFRSLRGRYGPGSQELAEIMLRSHLVHFIGSDAHRISQGDTTYLEALQRVEEIVGEERVKEVAMENPQAVLAGEALMGEREYTFNELHRRKKRNGFWSLFRR
ncbi:CpsB/CapC family capsule biosynthesis tyrosine phosphatase [Desulfosporosinus sp.]|uniref:tyrosine-protein phosphatase n=1 Tax=Desulfosporosinus sp. TaxID=157907 RepID=UPI0025C2AAB8|nr:CpsB/CapC family capsule biosynthesis tyrosine phosphatase [Desulfosporosinus sp.]MBC2722196.1 histidinol-phosphatase [Desulfosporosinus sp.]MBC2726050.1 histidinol-phosphatase [Desulfosporosinus sp.]